METREAICTRRSVRRFQDRPVADEILDALVADACRAPSGRNNQPWRFVIVRSAEKREALAGCTKYGRIIESAPAAVAVFLDTEASYHRDKDCQAIGAAIQNLLLSAHDRGLGACWLGEILNQRERVEAVCGVPPGLELMAVVAVGHPAQGAHGKADRLPLDRVVVGRI